MSSESVLECIRRFRDHRGLSPTTWNIVGFVHGPVFDSNRGHRLHRKAAALCGEMRRRGLIASARVRDGDGDVDVRWSLVAGNLAT